jgi:hypothetical protein
MSRDAVQTKRLRGAILDLVCARHSAQQTRMDSVALWHAMITLGFDLGENELITLLQDLGERKYLNFEEKKNRYTNRTEISRIGITPTGRDLCEKTTDDKAVLF